ncbi:MAG: hypothetical protein IPP86_00255 [Bacteroidetes bacterium]|nr:hypothetical protein [Bacteroidota bacterium]
MNIEALAQTFEPINKMKADMLEIELAHSLGDRLDLLQKLKLLFEIYHEAYDQLNIALPAAISLSKQNRQYESKLLDTLSEIERLKLELEFQK